jgi:hypothetical protein
MKIMKKHLIATAVAGLLFSGVLFAQNMNVPSVTWEKENGNFEANWGGSSGEDNSVMYSPSGQFLEIAKAISVKQLPPSAIEYVKSHYKGSSITEAALVTDAKGKVTYEAEVNHKDVVFDEKGNFVKTEKE